MAVKQTERYTPFEAGAVEMFERQLRGDVVRPGDAGYDEARSIWNGMIDKHPALIVRCLTTADVIAAVTFARDHISSTVTSQRLPVAVRGGGHNVAGNAVCDGGLMIDLSRMKGIHVDPVRRTARVQPGCDWGDLDRETQLHGLVTPGGQVSSTGIAGFTLGGGMGFLRRKWGLACDNLLSAEVVTADGQVLTASETEHPDLFWAIRGGGGNFGIVTSFEFQLHSLGPEVYGGIVVYPFDQLPDILRNWRDYLAGAPDEVTCDLMVWGMPPFPDVPPEMHWAPVVITGGVYAGPVDDGERMLRPVGEFGTPMANLLGPQPYLAIQSVVDPLFPDGQQYYWKSLFINTLDEEVMAAIVAVAADRPTPQTLFGLRGLGGAMGRVPEDATAYGNRDASYNLSIDTTWQDPADTERNIEWTRRAWSSLRDLTGGGVYLNFAGLGEENDALARAGHGRNYERLRAVKRRYDPTNLFRGNINITP